MLRVALAAGGLAAVAVACSSATPTEIVVGVSTQIAPRRLASVRVVARSGSATTCTTVRRDRPEALPIAVRVPATSGAAVDVTVAGYSGAPPSGECDLGTPLVARRATTSAVQDLALYLPMPLREACAGVDCPAGQTCAGGECLPAARPAASLVRYADPLVFDGTSFCFSRDQCFEDPGPAVPVDGEGCVFRIPEEAKLDERLNVQLVHADLSREVLDLDGAEGFARVPGSMTHYRLAPGLCKRYLARDIVAVHIGGNCPPKDPLQPLCRDAPASTVDAGSSPSGARCTSPVDLAPVSTSLYLLIDAAAAALPGEKGEAVVADGLARILAGPALRAARVAAHAMPASSAVCALPPAFASPGPPDGVAFDASVRSAGAASALFRLGRPVSPASRLGFDAAMQRDAAYRALAAEPTKRKMLALLGSRDFIASCGTPSVPLATLAATALREQRIRTATVVLKSPPGQSDGRDAYLEALIVGRAGEGPTFEGQFDDRALRRALVLLAAEATSCAYELPEAIAIPSNLSDVTISYFDVLTSKQVDVAYDPLCREGASTGNGWGLSGRNVVLCGKPCGALRNTFELSGVYALEHDAKVVDIPVKWTVPCAP